MLGSEKSILNYLETQRSTWNPGDIDPREGGLLYTLVRNFQPQRLVEIGHAGGYSTLWIAAGIEANETGILVSIDCEVEPQLVPKYQQRINESGASKFVRSVRGHSIEVIKKWTWDIAGFHGFYDFLFLDGDHTEEGAHSDLVNWLPHMSPHGIMVVHDTVKFFEDEIAQRLRDYKDEFFERAWPGKVIRRIVDEHKFEDFDFMTLDTSHGMTLIRRKRTL